MSPLTKLLLWSFLSFRLLILLKSFRFYSRWVAEGPYNNGVLNYDCIITTLQLLLLFYRYFVIIFVFLQKLY